MKDFTSITLCSETYANSTLIERQLLIEARLDTARYDVVPNADLHMAVYPRHGDLIVSLAHGASFLKAASVDLPQIPEWKEYLKQCECVLGGSEARAHELLSASFLGAASEPVDGSRGALGHAMAERLESEMGIRLGNGPDEHIARRLMLKLAHGLAMDILMQNQNTADLSWKPARLAR